jgi:hypothetical protein
MFNFHKILRLHITCYLMFASYTVLHICSSTISCLYFLVLNLFFLSMPYVSLGCDVLPYFVLV